MTYLGRIALFILFILFFLQKNSVAEYSKPSG